ncbi:MAG: DUF502 domain-containing protein [Mariniblastus sp.]
MANIKPKDPVSVSTGNVGTIRLLRNRIIAGLFVVLPLFITYFVVRWLYNTLFSIALNPISYFLRRAWDLENEKPSWWLDGMLSLAAFGLVLGILFVAGMFFQTRLHRAVDWILLNVPGVNTVYSAVSNVVNAVSSTHGQTNKFKRVVLVEFPHPGMKAPAFVTGDCEEKNTGKTILSVYVPTTPVPTSGYMLLVPEEDVVDLNWDLEETLQAIVSGGIALPDTVTYEGNPPPTINY